MITKDWKVSQVLDLYPETLDVFLGVSRHFAKLKNKVLRRTIARRVTLEQAARVGGVDVNSLLMKLNKKVGFDVDSTSLINSDSSGSVGAVHEPPLPDMAEVTLDVRPIIESGTDPFKTIMKTVREMKEGEMLHLVNSFEPVPLYSVMETKGFTHASEKRGDEWHIWFRKKGKHAAADQAKTSTYENKHSEKIEEIDVRGMEPPRPMVTILETLSRLDENTTLLVHHHREPVLLYDKLEEMGYEAETEKIDEQYYKITIKKK
jgi:uncharacterized protein (DUF2249 family)